MSRRSTVLIIGSAIVVGLAIAASIPIWMAQFEPWETGVRTQGGATVRVFITRGKRMFVWNGSDPIQEDDRLRLEVIAQPGNHVALLAQTESGDHAILYQGPLDPKEPLISESIPIARGGTEQRLIIAISTSAKNQAELEAAIAKPTPSVDLLQIRLPKK